MFGCFYIGIFTLFVMGNILFKVHESYRWVVAVCDKDVFGRKLVAPDQCPGPGCASGRRIYLYDIFPKKFLNIFTFSIELFKAKDI